MSEFKFNFSGEVNNQEQKDTNFKEIQWLQSEEVFPTDQIKDLDELVGHANMYTYGDLEIGHVVPKDILERIGSKVLNNAELADKVHSDLIPGKYEGGLKIWECTNDLIEYLVENEDKIQVKNARVLDLGCGAGILGIYTFMKGAAVTFQDYNKEVIECVTIPNVLLNIEEEDREKQIENCKFYSGDWACFNENLSDEDVYDLILTSETIYNPDNYDKLIELFMKRLKKDGAVYIAAKTYYFGVGGGTRQFETKIKNNGILKSEVCWKSSGGVQREIIRVTLL